jgi:hypothetical protein
MADPTKEELEMMARMILGKDYNPDFDPRSLGKREDAAVGPHPDWDPTDSEMNRSLQLLWPTRSPLWWEVWLEERRTKEGNKRAEWLAESKMKKWNRGKRKKEKDDEQKELKKMLETIISLTGKDPREFDTSKLGKSSDQWGPVDRIGAGLNPNFEAAKAFPVPDYIPEEPYPFSPVFKRSGMMSKEKRTLKKERKRKHRENLYEFMDYVKKLQEK